MARPPQESDVTLIVILIMVVKIHPQVFTITVPFLFVVTGKMVSALSNDSVRIIDIQGESGGSELNYSGLRSNPTNKVVNNPVRV